MKGARKQPLILAAVTVGALAPFLNKAFHVDDPLFLWMAQQIAIHPLDPYGFTVVWGDSAVPLWQEMQNPPLCSYYIALIGRLVGWSEFALHVGFLIPAVAAVLGTYAIARRACNQPTLAALLTLFAPAFLVSATNVMCDVLMLAFFVWSIECWMWAHDNHRWWLFLAGAVFAGLAALTKYFGMVLVPLLGAYTISRDYRSWPRLTFLLLPLGLLALFEHATEVKYGHGMVSGALAYTRNWPVEAGVPFSARALTGLCFVGGCVLSPLLFVPWRSWKFWVVASVIGAVVWPCFYFFVPRHTDAVGPNDTSIWIEGGLFTLVGVTTVVLATADLVRRRTPTSILLWLSIIGTIVFAAFLNWSITARTFLPMIPSVAIVLVRWFERTGPASQRPFARWWRVAVLALIAFAVTTADLRLANTGREAAAEFQRRFHSELGTVWVQGHWGFQYYVQQWGARPLDVETSRISSGDVALVFASTAYYSLPADKILTREPYYFKVVPFITTLSHNAGGGFYSNIRGPLPWAIARVPPEIYYVARFR